MGTGVPGNTRRRHPHQLAVRRADFREGGRGGEAEEAVRGGDVLLAVALAHRLKSLLKARVRLETKLDLPGQRSGGDALRGGAAGGEARGGEHHRHHLRQGGGDARLGALHGLAAVLLRLVHDERVRNGAPVGQGGLGEGLRVLQGACAIDVSVYLSVSEQIALLRGCAPR